MTTLPMINVFQPSCGEEELAAVQNVFASNWLGKGKKTAQFEKNFFQWLGADSGHTLSVNSCTEGLFQLMEVLDLQAGDEVILPTCHFVGTANAIAARGYRTVFCDIDERSLNVNAEYLENKITEKTKAVCILHYGGVPCDMDDIVSLCKSRGLYLIEDAATAVASSYKGRACGTFGHAGTWSFDAMKILVCGDGGMIYVKDENLAHKLRQKMYLGLLSQSGFSNTVDSKWWEFQIDCFGRRTIMNDIASAIGLVQLNKLPSFIERRGQLHKKYSEMLSKFSWLSIPPHIPDDKKSSFYLYWIQLHNTEDRDALAIHLRNNKIYTTFRYYPLHHVKLYSQTNISLPNAEVASLKTLCLPLHQSMTFEDVERICAQIYAFKGSY